MLEINYLSNYFSNPPNFIPFTQSAINNSSSLRSIDTESTPPFRELVGQKIVFGSFWLRNIIKGERETGGQRRKTIKKKILNVDLLASEDTAISNFRQTELLVFFALG